MKRKLLTIVLALATIAMANLAAPTPAEARSDCWKDCSPTNLGQPLCDCSWTGVWLNCAYAPHGDPCPVL